MRYFIPEWDDKVDPNYNFITDTHSAEHKASPLENDAYMWDLFGTAQLPFDGLLVSIATVQDKKKKYAMIEEKGIHGFFGLSKEFPIMADCGAFSYIDEIIPPYKTSEVLKTYQDLDVNYGVSVDHLVVSAFSDQKEERMRITYQNGLEAFNEWKRNYQNDFQLIVSVQGYDIPDYLRMYNKFLDHGINTLALGGLVRSQTSYIVKLIDALVNEIKTKRRAPEYLHFFGVARSELLYKLNELEELGVEVAFDSASYLRRAWLASPDTQGNYITQDQKGYTAIRIPQKLSKKYQTDGEENDIGVLDDTCLQALRAYDRDEITLDEVMCHLKDLNTITQGKPEYLNYYRKLLEEKPWKDCPCPICREIGIDAVIFRGNNRNRRRGFHNTISFYHLLQRKELWDKRYLAQDITSLQNFRPKGKVLVITGCTKNKCILLEGMTAPAKELYQGTLFKKTREFCERSGYDYRIISAKYGFVHPEDELPTYEKMLKKKSDIVAIQPSVEKGLSEIIDTFDTILVIAGKNYRETLRNVIDERFVFVKSRGIGDLVHIVSEAIPKPDRRLDEFQ